jgi:hypothetical protein
MKPAVTALLLLSLAPAMPAAAQSTSAPKEKTITLSDQHKQAVINAALSINSRQKTPKEFSPSVGATVPKELYLHAFSPSVVQEAPQVKEYWYAFLDREVVLVDALEMKVAAVVDLPQELISTDQPHHGAAEPGSNAQSSAGSPVGSVPSHTSPESIK